MKTLWNAFSILLMLHLLAALAMVGWLNATNRLDRDRAVQAYELFKPTLAEEEVKIEKIEELAAQNREQVERESYLEQVAAGPTTIADRLSTEERDTDVALHRAQRLEREVRSVQALLENAKELLAKKRKEFDTERQAFDKKVAQMTQRRRDEDFQRAVSTVEKLKPEQAKQFLQELLVQGKKDEVVEYLATMELRRSAAVLRKFTSPDEITTAAALIQGVRDRGIEISAKLSADGADT